VVSVTDPYGRIIGFLDRSRYFFFQVAPPLLIRKSGIPGIEIGTSGSVARNSDHLLCLPGMLDDDECGEVGGMIAEGYQGTRREPA
jgi:hypothetical protein